MNRPTALKLAIVNDGRTQRVIAAEAGIQEATLSRIVRGLHADEATREAIARVLGLHADVVFPPDAQTITDDRAIA